MDIWSLFDTAAGSSDISEIARYRLSSSKSEIRLSLPDVVKYYKVYLGKVLRILIHLTRALPQWTRLFYMARYHQTLPEEANIVSGRLVVVRQSNSVKLTLTLSRLLVCGQRLDRYL